MTASSNVVTGPPKAGGRRSLLPLSSFTPPPPTTPSRTRSPSPPRYKSKRTVVLDSLTKLTRRIRIEMNPTYDKYGWNTPINKETRENLFHFVYRHRYILQKSKDQLIFLLGQNKYLKRELKKTLFIPRTNAGNMRYARRRFDTIYFDLEHKIGERMIKLLLSHIDWT